MKIKRYILFVYDKHYPDGGWNDYVNSFNNTDEAKKAIQCIVKGRDRIGNLFRVYIYNKNEYDYYLLIDLHRGKNINLFNKPTESYIN